MFINKSWFTFRRDDLPKWQCPSCGSASLNLNSEEFRVYESAATTHQKDEDWFDADFVQYRYSAALHCSNNYCKEIVSMVGSGKVEEEHKQDYEGKWETNYHDSFTPLFFEPCLIPIYIPEDTPSGVTVSLLKSFSLIFANRDAAANQLRVALEVILDEQGVKAIDKNGDPVKLGSLIDSHLNTSSVKNQGLITFKERLSAIRWIGNEGSHGNDAITRDDLLAGLLLIESIIFSLYPSPKNDLDALALTMINRKRPKKTGGK